MSAVASGGPTHSPSRKRQKLDERGQAAGMKKASEKKDGAKMRGAGRNNKSVADINEQNAESGFALSSDFLSVPLCRTDGLPGEHDFSEASLAKEFSYPIHETRALHDRNEYRHIRLKNGIHAVLVTVKQDSDEASEPLSPGLRSGAEDCDNSSAKDGGVEGSGSGLELENSNGEAGTRPGAVPAASSSSASGIISIGRGEGSTAASNDELKAACAVTVGVGQFSDPVEVQGVAHFCEHMLFMGSTKYPGENAHEQFLTANGGYSNAFTEVEQTTYYFECDNGALEKACDMTAQFFIAPSMEKEAVEREIKAIESEFRLSQNSDQTRIDQVFAHHCTKGHSYNSFGWGNLKSLKDDPAEKAIDIHRAVREFYEKNYTSDRISVCLVSTQGLDELEGILRKSFANIPRRLSDLAVAVSGGAAAAPSKPTAGGSSASGRGKAVGVAAMKSSAGSSSSTSLFFRHPLIAEYRPKSNSLFPPIQDKSLPMLLRQKPVADTHKLHIAWVLPPIKEPKTFYKHPLEVIGHCIGHESKGSILEYLKQKHYATSLTGGQGQSGYEDSSICTLFTAEVTLTKKGMQNWPEVVEVIFAGMEMIRGELERGLMGTASTSAGSGAKAMKSAATAPPSMKRASKAPEERVGDGVSGKDGKRKSSFTGANDRRDSKTGEKTSAGVSAAGASLPLGASLVVAPKNSECSGTEDTTDAAGTNKLRQIYSEARLLNNLEYQFQEEERAVDTAQRISGVLAPCSGVRKCDVLSGAYYFAPELDLALTKSFFDRMTVDRMILGLLSSSYGQAERNEEPEEDDSAAEGDEEAEAAGEGAPTRKRSIMQRHRSSSRAGMRKMGVGSSSGLNNSEDGSGSEGSSSFGSDGEADEEQGEKEELDRDEEMSDEDASRMTVRTERTAASRQAARAERLDPWFDTRGKEAKWCLEPYFETEFCRSSPPLPLLHAWRNAKALRKKYLDTNLIHFPAANPFLPTEFRLRSPKIFDSPRKLLMGGGGGAAPGAPLSAVASGAAAVPSRDPDQYRLMFTKPSLPEGPLSRSLLLSSSTSAPENSKTTINGAKAASAPASAKKQVSAMKAPSAMKAASAMKSAKAGVSEREPEPAAPATETRNPKLPNVEQQPFHVPVLFEHSAVLVPDRLVSRFEKKQSKKALACDAIKELTPLYRFYAYPKNFDMPKTQVLLRFYPLHHDILSTPDAVCLTWLTRALEDRQTDVAYQADIAQLQVTLTCVPEGYMVLHLWGFSQKLPVLLQQVLANVMRFPADYGCSAESAPAAANAGMPSSSSTSEPNGVHNVVAGGGGARIPAAAEFDQQLVADRLQADGRIEVMRQKLARKYSNANLESSVHADRLRQELLVASCHDLEAQVGFLDPADDDVDPVVPSRRNSSAAAKVEVLAGGEGVSSSAAAGGQRDSKQGTNAGGKSSASSALPTNFANLQSRLANFAPEERRKSGGAAQTATGAAASSSAAGGIDLEELNKGPPGRLRSSSKLHEERLKPTYAAFADYVRRFYSLYRLDMLVEGNQDEDLLQEIAGLVKSVTGVGHRQLSEAEAKLFTVVGGSGSKTPGAISTATGSVATSSTSSTIISALSSTRTNSAECPIPPQERCATYDEVTAHWPLNCSLCQKIPPSTTLLSVQPSADPAQKNTVVQIYYQFERTTPRLSAANEYLADLLYEPLFNELRTKQQLGYSVSCGIRDSYGIAGFLITLASSSHNAVELVERTLKFVQNFDLERDIGKEVMEQVRVNCAKRLLEPYRNMGDLAEAHWGAILETRTPRWQYDREMAHALESVDVNALFQQLKNPERGRIATAVLSASTEKNRGKYETQLTKLFSSGKFFSVKGAAAGASSKPKAKARGSGVSEADRKLADTLAKLAAKGQGKVVKYQDSRKFWRLKKSRDAANFFHTDRQH